MRFRLWWKEVGAPDGAATSEDLARRGHDALELGEAVMANFNETLRPGEVSRVVVRVEANVGEGRLAHRWRKTNLVTVMNPRGRGSWDEYVCADCGVVGKRFTLGGPVEHRSKKRECPGDGLPEGYTRRVPR